MRIRIVSGDEEHSSLDTLRNNFSIKDLRPLVKDGRLARWLSQKGEKELAEKISKFRFNSEESCPDKEETMLFISLFFPEYLQITFDELLKKWEEDTRYARNVEHIRSYLKASLPLSEALKIHQNNNSYFTKENWILILMNSPISEVMDLFVGEELDNILGLDDWHSIFSQKEAYLDGVDLFVIGKTLVEKEGYKKRGIEFIQKSGKLGNVSAKKYLNKELDKLLLRKFPEGTYLLNEEEKKSSKFRIFLTHIEWTYKNDRFISGNYAYLGKYDHYMKICEYLYNYKNTDKKEVKRQNIEKIKRYDYLPIGKYIYDCYRLTTPINGKNFQDLTFKEYLKFLVELIEQYGEYEE